MEKRVNERAGEGAENEIGSPTATLQEKTDQRPNRRVLWIQQLPVKQHIQRQPTTVQQRLLVLWIFRKVDSGWNRERNGCAI